MRKLEVIVLNAADSIAAEKAGADRLELVTDMAHGGLSPEIEIVRDVVSSVSIPVNVMVRFEYDGFEYTHQQFLELLEYVESVKKLGINGVVFGSLTSEGLVDEDQLEAIIEAADGLDITFHRAIDEVDNNYLTNFNLINGKVTTVLSSGGTDYPLIDNLASLNAVSESKTRLLIGGGINANNYQLVIDSVVEADIHIGSLAYNQGDFKLGINEKNVALVKSYLTKENHN
ncbi:copper homeostasis protein CutC [Mollicutes bacterium LVI A0078]|nr:copper homeostasis protein CutC [Mollicutes bacterium LVI A0075]WOO90248.1 copper homeostasis protein CutC [Mollicutes bacterium LVI A0078]